MIKSVGIIELIGGVVTSIYAAYAMATLDATAATRLIFAILLLVSIASATAGTLLLRRHRLGVLLSAVLQVIQLPAFSVASTVYYLGLGLFMAFGLYLPQVSSSSLHLSLHWQFGLGTDFLVRLGEPAEEQYVAVNLVALALLALLWQSKVRSGDRAAAGA